MANNRQSLLSWRQKTKVKSFIFVGDKSDFNLEGLSHGILSYFNHRQNYRYIEGNLKMILFIT